MGGKFTKHIDGGIGRAICGAAMPPEEDGNGIQPPWSAIAWCGSCVAMNRAAQNEGRGHADGAAAASFAAVKIAHGHFGSSPVVISMTSVPSRNESIGATIASIREQTRKPDMIRLYVGPECAHYSDRQSPPVTVVGVEDRGPVTKLSAIADRAVRDDAIVITIDDDIIFHRDWLATLVQFAHEFPDDAVGMAGWNAGPLLQDGIFEKASGPCDVIEGFAGVAYRKWFFGPDVLHPPPEMKWVDDVWISSYLHRAGVVRRVVHDRMVDISRSVETGIHTRPDFKALNQAAARAAFTTKERAALEARREAAMAARWAVPR